MEDSTVTTAEPSMQETYAWLASEIASGIDSQIILRGDLVPEYTANDYILDLLKVEEFVTTALSSEHDDETRYETDWGNTKKKGYSALIRFFESIHDLYTLKLPGYEYSDHVELFFFCFEQLHLEQDWFHLPTKDSLVKHNAVKRLFLFKRFVDLIRVESKMPAFRSKMYLRRYKPQRRMRSAEENINKVFRIYSRVQVMRIDLGYQKEFAKSVTMEQAKKDFTHFMNNRRGNPKLFAKCVRHIAKLEWGIDKGFHFHVIFIYKGRDILKDIYWTREIGEYWKKVIPHGTYFNCNAKQNEYTHLGIGRIERTDMEKRHNLQKYVVGYLAKSDQYLRAIKLGSGRCFFQGAPRKHSNAGRPRVDKDDL